MLVLCYGMQKSGSTLAFELVRAMLLSSGFEQPFVRNDRPRSDLPADAPRLNYVQRLTEEKLAGLIETIGPERRIAVKTHAPFRDAMFAWLEDQQARGRLVVVASYRDPRDLCLALRDAGETSRRLNGRGFTALHDLDDAIHYVERSIAKYRKWAALRGTVRLNYETLAFAPETAIDVLEAALGLRYDREAVLRHAFRDAYTLKNKARPSRHREEMSADEIARTTAIFRDFIAHACEKDDQAWYDAARPI